MVACKHPAKGLAALVLSWRSTCQTVHGAIKFLTMVHPMLNICLEDSGAPLLEDSASP